MVRFLIYIVVVSLMFLGVYTLGPDSGVVEIHNENFYFETSIAVFFILLIIVSILISLLILLLFWVLKLPSRLKSALDNYFYKKKVEKMLDIIYLVWTKKLKEADKKYNIKDFEFMNHQMLEEVKQEISEYKKKL